MKHLLKRYLSLLGPAGGLLLVLAIFGGLTPERFLTVYNLKIVALQSVIVALGAMGMTVVMVGGGIDLSVGSIIALTTVVTATGLNLGLPAWQAVGAAVLAAGLVGLVNGLLVTRLRIVAFIATLGTLEIVRGLAQFLGGEQKINAPATWIALLMAKEPEPAWLFLSWGVWAMLLLLLFMAWFLKYTLLGRHIFAVGSNENTARLCGVNVNGVKVKVYVISGLFAGLAGIAQFARLGMGDPTVAVGKELDIVAAAVIGGASLSGGKGSIPGAVVGALIMALLRNGCTLLGISSPAQKMVIGAIIVLAVALDRWRARGE